MVKPPNPPRQWPLWLLGATLLTLLGLATLYWVDPEMLNLPSAL